MFVSINHDIIPPWQTKASLRSNQEYREVTFIFNSFKFYLLIKTKMLNLICFLEHMMNWLISIYPQNCLNRMKLFWLMIIPLFTWLMKMNWILKKLTTLKCFTLIFTSYSKIWISVKRTTLSYHLITKGLALERSIINLCMKGLENMYLEQIN